MAAETGEAVGSLRAISSSRVSPGVFTLLLLQRAAAHEQRSVSLSLIVSVTRC